MQTGNSSLFDALLDASADNISVVDRNGRYTHVSRGGASTVGKTREEIVGRTWREIGLPAELMEKVESDWNRVFSTGKTVRDQVFFRGRYFEYSMFPLLDCVVVVSRDVTERVATEERYRAFVANSSEAIWRFEVDEPIDASLPEDEQIDLAFQRGYLAECNDATARIYGFEHASEIIGARLPDMLDPTQVHNREFLRAFIRAGYRLVDAESIESDRHGNRKYFLNSFIGTVENGKLQHAWGTQRDVTEQRAINEQLRRGEERLQALVAATTQVVWTTDAEGHVNWVTTSWTDLTGEGIDRAMDGGWFDRIHPDEHDAVLRAWNDARDTKKVFHATVRFRTRDGTYRWLQVRTAPVLNHDGTIREWIGASVDVDVEKRHAGILAAQRRRAEFIADANDLFVRSLDYEETLRNLARMAVPRLADWCAVDMLKPDGTFRRLAVEHAEPAMVKLAYELQKRFPEDRSSPYGTYEVLRTGRTVWMPEIPGEMIEAGARSPEHLSLLRKLLLRSYICAPIHVRDRVAGVLTLVNTAKSRSFTDTDVELAEELALRAGHAIENARLYQQALEANRAKDEFLATLSHELRTPLTAILGWANLLRISNYEPQTVRTATETIEQSAKAQAALIDDLLDISRIVTGKLKLHIAPVDLVPVVEAGIAAVRPAADARRISIEVDAPDSLPMKGDDNRIQQIVWNLMSNAVKFSAEGSRIRVSVAREDGQVVMRVNDQGIGIEPALLPHVFERFWQADGSSQRSHSGLGLGLAIVKYLSELHGGTAEAQSEGRGQGATFTIRIPVGEPARDTDVAAASLSAARRVLLVDDDEPAREVVRRTLEHFGANVTPASSATEAMSLLEKNTYDLVLTDIAMPQNDGYWLLGEIRRSKPYLRVAAITALGHSDDQLASAGFDSFVRKPVEVSRLAELLNG